jgi:N-acyl-L-homoserine lactone synthetase
VTIHSDQYDSTHPVRLGPYDVEFAAPDMDRTAELQLRYRIFVEERRWLPPDAHRQGIETDEFDPFSYAFLLRDAATGEAVACQRLVLPDRLPTGKLTQIEHLTLAYGLDLASRPRDTWAEASRTSIAPHYRQGSANVEMPAIVAMKYPTLALARVLRRDALYSISDPRFARLARRQGVPMHRIGPVLDYHGPHAPYRFDVDEIAASVDPRLHETLAQLIDAARRVCSPAN